MMYCFWRISKCHTDIQILTDLWSSELIIYSFKEVSETIAFGVSFSYFYWLENIIGLYGLVRFYFMVDIQYLFCSLLLFILKSNFGYLIYSVMIESIFWLIYSYKVNTILGSHLYCCYIASHIVDAILKWMCSTIN